MSCESSTEPQEFQKKPAESYGIGLEYTVEKLPAGALIASGTATATAESDGSNASTLLFGSDPATLTIAADGLSWAVGLLAAGVDGEDYEIRATLTLTGGQVLQDCVELHVRDC